MTAPTTASLEERVVGALNDGNLSSDDMLGATFGDVEALLDGLAARNLKIVEMKDGE